jgi:hypothetical protein
MLVRLYVVILVAGVLLLRHHQTNTIGLVFGAAL